MTRINHTDVRSKKNAEIQFLWSLNCFYNFSVFLVSALNYKKCLEVTENCIQGQIFVI